MDRLQLLRQNNKTQSPKIRLITHYNRNNPNFNQILKDHTGLLLMTRKEAIKPEDIQITYSRSPNLRHTDKRHIRRQPTNKRHYTMWEDQMQDM